MQAGDKVKFWHLNEQYEDVMLKGEVISTFYEPGDPIMAVNIKGDDGKIYGSVDSQDVWPDKESEK